MKMEKRNVEGYFFTNLNKGGWATIYIDEIAHQSGSISIASAMGNWNVYFGSCGCSFKEFLCDITMEYLARKVGEGMKLNVEGTILLWKKACLSSRRDGTLSKKKARKIFDELNELVDLHCNERELAEEATRKKRVMRFFNYCPETVNGVGRSFRLFWKEVYVPFMATLEAEIAAEKEEAKCD